MDARSEFSAYKGSRMFRDLVNTPDVRAAGRLNVIPACKALVELNRALRAGNVAPARRATIEKTRNRLRLRLASMKR